MSAPATWRGVSVIRRGRDWLETILIRALGRGWDSVGPDAAERLRLEREALALAAEREGERRARRRREQHEANAARRRALGAPTHTELEALARERGQTLCGGGVGPGCHNPIDDYPSAWRRAHDGFGLCRDCDEAMDRDHADLTAAGAGA